MKITQEQAENWTTYINGRARKVSLVYCEICGRRNVTLLNREGKRVCKSCYEKVLQIRTLKKT